MTASTQLKGSQNYIWSMLDVLGQGATGAVYKARHKKTGELFAVKLFNQVSHARPIQVQMREFDVLKKLKHENIVRLLDIEEETALKVKVLVMELCTEGSLYNILDNPENACGIPEDQFFLVLRDVAAGMMHLRENDIVHRDIKPGNIMKFIGDDGKAVFKLIDFGAARELDDEEQFMSLYGTEEYLHPDLYERAVLRRPAGKQFGVSVDLWSLGVTLYHVATGQLPFRPFGGRRNRETMYKITTEKESGVISGVQMMDGGMIQWKRDLPASCRLSHGAQQLVVPVLAGLMECDPRKMWTFDKFFNITEQILKQKVVNVFNLCTGDHIHVFINPDQMLSKFQEQIAAQTDIPASNQYLLFENMLFTDFVTPMQKVGDYPETEDSSPVFLYYRNSLDSVQLHQPDIPLFPPISASVQLDQDVQLTKACAGNLFHIKRTVGDMLLKQQLIGKAAKMYIVVLTRTLLQVQGYVTQFHSLVEEIGKRVRQFQLTHQMNLQMVELLKTSMDGAFREWNEDWMELSVLFDQHRATYTEISKDAEWIKGNVEDYVEKVVTQRQLCKRWLQRQGCKEEENCMEKIDILSKAVKQTLVDFRKNKALKKLSYNEEQIHKFEKSKLNMYVSKALSLIQSHCLRNLQIVYSSFQDWFSKASEMRRNTEVYEERLSVLVNSQISFSEILDQAQASHAEKFEKTVKRLRHPDSGFVKFPVTVSDGPGHVMNGGQETKVKKKTPQENATGSMTVAQSLMSADHGKVLLKELSKSFSEMKGTYDETRELMQENQELLESLKSIQYPPKQAVNFGDMNLNAT